MRRRSLRSQASKSREASERYQFKVQAKKSEKRKALPKKKADNLKDKVDFINCLPVISSDSEGTDQSLGDPQDKDIGLCGNKGESIRSRAGLCLYA